MSKLITPALTSDDAGPLTVADLIALLHNLPQDLPIAIPGCEGGYSPVIAILQKTLVENVNDVYWYGSHDDVEAVTESEIIERKLTKSDYVILLTN